MSSFDQVIRNILADIFAEEEQQEVTRTKARPEGLMSNNKPQNTQEDAEPVQPSASKSTSDFVKAMADYDDTPEEGVEIPLAFFKGTARDIEGRYKATGMQLVKANRDRVNDRIKVPTIEKDPKEEYADDLMAHLNALGIIKTGKKDFIPSTRDIQIMLSDRGYNVGTIDGIMGNKTEAAIRAFQKDVGFTGKDVDGNFGRKTFEAFMNTTPSSSPISQEELEPAPMNFSGTKTQREKIQDILDRDDFIKRDPGFELSTPTITVSSNIKKTKEEKENVQRALIELGYDVGEVDGVIGNKTRAAIRQFQKDNNLSADAVVGKNTAAAMNEALIQTSPTSIYDTPAQVGPDQMQVGFSKDDADALSTDLRYQEYLRREEDKEQRNTIETSKLITEAKDDSGITRPRARPESTEETVEVVDASVFGGLGYALGELGLGTSEYRFFANNIINPGGTYTEKDLNGSDKRLLKKAISSARADGRNYVDYEKDFGVDEKDVNKASPFAGIIDPTMRMARTVGVFRFSTDDEGNTIIEDTFDFNYGPKRGAYQDAVKRGDKKEALYLLSPLAGTSPVEAASMIGYVRQENLKARGEPYQTNIRINLGKF